MYPSDLFKIELKWKLSNSFSAVKRCAYSHSCSRDGEGGMLETAGYETTDEESAAVERVLRKKEVDVGTERRRRLKCKWKQRWRENWKRHQWEEQRREKKPRTRQQCLKWKRGRKRWKRRSLFICKLGHALLISEEELFPYCDR